MVVQFGGGWRCLGPGAWHPLVLPWVPLPVPEGGRILGARGQGLASPDLLVCAAQHFAGGGFWEGSGVSHPQEPTASIVHVR